MPSPGRAGLDGSAGRPRSAGNVRARETGRRRRGARGSGLRARRATRNGSPPRSTHALLVVLQAMDAAGKDGAIEHAMSGVNPQGVRVVSFKAPPGIELEHDYLWRHVVALPERGKIGIFNRSHYEEVLVVRVHPEILEAQRLPPELEDEGIWQRRFERDQRVRATARRERHVRGQDLSQRLERGATASASSRGSRSPRSTGSSRRAT